jgi:hypothetical protein
VLHTLVYIACLLGAAPAPNPFLKQAKDHYDQFQFGDCLQRMAQARQWPSSPSELVEMELYAGLCHASSGATQDASRHFRLARAADPDVKLPPYTSPKIAELFEKSRPVLAPDVPNDAPLLDPKPAPRPLPTMVAKEPGSRPWLRWLPVAALGIAAASTGTVGVLSGMSAKRLEGEANAASYDADRERLGLDASSSATRANVLYGVAAACLVSTVVVYLITSD